jgi:hypothetical protein
VVGTGREDAERGGSEGKAARVALISLPSMLLGCGGSISGSYVRNALSWR